MYQTMLCHRRTAMNKKKKGVDNEQEKDSDSTEDHKQGQSDFSESVDTQEFPRKQRTRIRTVVPPSNIHHKGKKGVM